jgi:hypothetical protein
MPNERTLNRRRCAAAMLGAARTMAIPDLKITAIHVHVVSQPLREPMDYCCAPGDVLGMT